jgi:hypothetical protein
MYVFLGNASTPTALHPFVASEDPERVRELIRSGRPVYWIINDPWKGRRSPEFDTLQRSFRLEALAAGVAKNGIKQPFFGRMYELPGQH